MAGEIEEPFSFSFQADTLHSGSISFGRFESEPLSWERRSSFSHNRYLEEVEKYSKPGSVIEKKAYFEAHFRKKALMRLASSECQTGSGTEQESIENDALENMGYLDDFDHVNEARKHGVLENIGYERDFVHANEALENGVHVKLGQHKDFDYVNEPSHSVHFDKSDGSENGEECEEHEIEIEDHKTLYSEPECEADRKLSSCKRQFEQDNKISVPLPQMEHAKVDNFSQVKEPMEAHQSETRRDDFLNVNPEVKQDLDEEASNVDELPESINQQLIIETTGKTVVASLEHLRAPSPKVRNAAEAKLINPRSKSLVNSTQIKKKLSDNASKDIPKVISRRKSPLRIKPEKRSSQATIPTTISVYKSPKQEDSESSKGKLIEENKSSKKEPRAKKVVTPQSSTLEKIVSGARQMTNRFKHTVNSTSPEMNLNAAGFSFKSDLRAERRKQFDMKLEEKMHAKEAELNQIEAKVQEKKVAEMKQFRKGLNFRATPMPSFYGTDKVAIPSDKSSKPRKIPITSGSRNASTSVNLSHHKVSGSSISPFPSTDRSHPQSSGIKIETGGRKEHHREKGATQNHTVPEISKSRKNTKCSNMGTGSRKGNLGVGVS